MGRPRRIIQTTYPYHITTRTNNKEFRFNKKKVIKIFAEVLTKAAKKYNVTLLHVVIMSNHYHIILKINHENLHRFLQFVNSRIAMAYNKLTKRSGHLWGDRYKSTIIESDQHYLNCVRYIYENPVRAKIVNSPENFLNSSFHFHAFGKKIDLVVVKDMLILQLSGKKHNGNYNLAFQGLFEKQDYSPHNVRDGLKKRFFGSPAFIKYMEALYSP